jgi:hypothetical protein
MFHRISKNTIYRLKENRELNYSSYDVWAAKNLRSFCLKITKRKK